CSFVFFSSRSRHTRSKRDWSSDVCSSDLNLITIFGGIYLTLKWQKDPEYLALVEDLLDNEMVQKLEMYKHHHVTNRLLHSLSVRSEERRVGKESRSRRLRGE